MNYDQRNQPVIDSLKRELFREEQKIEAAKKRIFEIEIELIELGGIETPRG